MKKSHLISLIVPIYKQEKTILASINGLKSVLDTIRYYYEIIVVIDGIVDRSYKKISTAKIPHIICIAYQKHQGKSFALRMGMRMAKGKYIMFIDGDLDVDPNSISILLEYMEWHSADIIVGSKRHPASKISYPLSRKILSIGYYLIVKILFNVRIHDTQAGIKVFKRNVLKTVLPYLVEKKFAGDLEMLVVADSLGFIKIYEAPIKIQYTAGSITSAATLRSIFGILLDTFAIFYRLKITHFYDKPHRSIYLSTPLSTLLHNR
ncbi:glycosyltransferase family 2 protein [Candidatus Gottesmanbacteria bacterium]|nr:glycosyltransferase family 2 protein [Candidatus Gottesmanbacteria bacterium]